MRLARARDSRRVGALASQAISKPISRPSSSDNRTARNSGVSISNGNGQSVTVMRARFDTAKTTRTSASGAVTSQWNSFMDGLVYACNRRTNPAPVANPSIRNRACRTACVRAAWPRWRSRLLVEPLAQLLAGLEERDVLFAHVNAFAGARIATYPRAAPFDREGAEAAQLNTVAAR